MHLPPPLCNTPQGAFKGTINDDDYVSLSPNVVYAGLSFPPFTAKVITANFLVRMELFKPMHLLKGKEKAIYNLALF